jgi:hypothetical protein
MDILAYTLNLRHLIVVGLVSRPGAPRQWRSLVHTIEACIPFGSLFFTLPCHVASLRRRLGRQASRNTSCPSCNIFHLRSTTVIATSACPRGCRRCDRPWASLWCALFFQYSHVLLFSPLPLFFPLAGGILSGHAHSRPSWPGSLPLNAQAPQVARQHRSAFVARHSSEV